MHMVACRSLHLYLCGVDMRGADDISAHPIIGEIPKDCRQISAAGVGEHVLMDKLNFLSFVNRKLHPLIA